MERLLADAEKFSGVKYDINNLGDVYEAIHVIQGELGLTGVAAAEASETLSGSFGAMRASWDNFIGSVAIGENVSESMSNLMTTTSTFFFGNFIPMLGTIIKSLPSAIATFFREGVPTLLSNVSSLISNFANTLTTSAQGLTGEKVKAWATTTLPKILSAAASILGKFASGLIKNIPKILVALAKIGAAIVRGLGSALWGKVTAAANGIKERFLRPINALKDRVKAIIEKIKNFFNFKTATPHIKLPHFTISPAGWKVGDLLKGVKPSLSISWYAKGGIVDGATVFGGVGLGEAGPEAILPLKPFWDKMDRMAENMQGGNTYNFYISGADKNPKEIAQEVKQILIKETNQRRLAWQ